MKDHITLEAFGQHAVLINWAAQLTLSHEIVAYLNWIEKKFPEEIQETVPAYHSAVIYLSVKVNVHFFIEKLKKYVPKISELKNQTNHFVFTIPVCYDQEFGLDIKEVSKVNDLSTLKLIELHTQPIYRVQFIGFLPGFPYLSGLREPLHTPRKENPRPFIEKGAVGIGGGQTGIYPVDSPGGWNIIGKTPVRLFDPHLEKPSLLRAGDYLKFESVTKVQFNLMELEVASGTFQINKKAYHD